MAKHWFTPARQQMLLWSTFKCGCHSWNLQCVRGQYVSVSKEWQSPQKSFTFNNWMLVKLSRVQLHASNWRSQHFNHLLKCPLISPFFPNFLPCLLQVVLFWRHDDEEPELAEEELVLGCRWCLCWYSFWHVAPAEGDEEFGADWTAAQKQFHSRRVTANNMLLRDCGGCVKLI